MKYGAEAVDSMKTCCFPSHAEHPEAMWFVFEKLNGKMVLFLSLRLSSVEMKKEGQGEQDDFHRGLHGADASAAAPGGATTASRAGCGDRLWMHLLEQQWQKQQPQREPAQQPSSHVGSVLSAPQAEGLWAPGGGGRRSSECDVRSQSHPRAFYTPERITGDAVSARRLQSEDARSLLPALPPAPAPSSFLLILCFWNQTFVSNLERLGAISWRAKVPIVSPPSGIIFFMILKSDACLLFKVGSAGYDKRFIPQDNHVDVGMLLYSTYNHVLYLMEILDLELLLNIFLFFFWRGASCGILLPWPGIEAGSTHSKSSWVLTTGPPATSNLTFIMSIFLPLKSFLEPWFNLFSKKIAHRAVVFRVFSSSYFIFILLDL